MKREGYQHGMVRSNIVRPFPWDPKPKSRVINKFDSPPTAGIFVKASSKPTNHSKFTSKCGEPGCYECHAHHGSKSKDKGKGNQKLKASSMTMDNRSLAWKVVDKGQGLTYGGKSATGILCLMSSDDYYNDDDEIEEAEEEETVILSKEVETESEIDAGFVWEDQLEGDEGWYLVEDF